MFGEVYARDWTQGNAELIAGVASFAFAHERAFGNYVA